MDFLFMLFRVFNCQKTAHEFPDHNGGSLENLVVGCSFTGYTETCAQLIFNSGTDFIT